MGELLALLTLPTLLAALVPILGILATGVVMWIRRDRAGADDVKILESKLLVRSGVLLVAVSVLWALWF